MAHWVKNPPAVQETQVQSLGWEDPLEEGMAIHSSILTWRIPWTEEPGGLQSLGHKESDMMEATEHAGIAKMTARIKQDKKTHSKDSMGLNE